MMTRLSKWMLYAASYRVVFVELLIVTTLDGVATIDVDDNLTRLQTILMVIKHNELLVIVLIGLFALSSVYIFSFFHQQNNTRIKTKMTDNKVIEESSSLLPIIVTAVMPLIISDHGLLISVIIFIVLGLAFVLSNHIQASPIFISHGYRLLNGGKKYVITKMTRERFNIAIEDNPDGIEARELVPNVYITL